MEAGLGGRGHSYHSSWGTKRAPRRPLYGSQSGRIFARISDYPGNRYAVSSKIDAGSDLSQMKASTLYRDPEVRDPKKTHRMPSRLSGVSGRGFSNRTEDKLHRLLCAKALSERIRHF